MPADDDAYRAPTATPAAVASFSARPWVTLAVMTAGLLYAFVMIVPKFQAMFETLGGKLPSLTVFVITLSQFLCNNLIAVLVALGIAVFVVVSRRPIIPGPVYVGVRWGLIVLIVLIPVGVFLPILQLQAAVR